MLKVSSAWCRYSSLSPPAVCVAGDGLPCGPPVRSGLEGNASCRLLPQTVPAYDASMRSCAATVLGIRIDEQHSL